MCTGRVANELVLAVKNGPLAVTTKTNLRKASEDRSLLLVYTVTEAWSQQSLFEVTTIPSAHVYKMHGTCKIIY